MEEEGKVELEEAEPRLRATLSRSSRICCASVEEEEEMLLWPRLLEVEGNKTEEGPEEEVNLLASVVLKAASRPWQCLLGELLLEVIIEVGDELGPTVIEEGDSGDIERSTQSRDLFSVTQVAILGLRSWLDLITDIL